MQPRDVHAQEANRWTVNDPLDFSKDGPKEMEAFLIRNHQEGVAYYHAENVCLGEWL